MFSIGDLRQAAAALDHLPGGHAQRLDFPFSGALIITWSPALDSANWRCSSLRCDSLCDI